MLVVCAHPDPDSYGAALTAAVLSGLARATHTTDLIDLYAEGYDPNLSQLEHAQYETISSDHPDSVVREHLGLLKSADALIFVYPTFWGGMPAILKGWLDRTMLPGVAFGLDPVSRKIKGELTNVCRLVGITTYGSRPLYRYLVGDAGRRTIRRVIRFSCGARCRSRWLSLDALDSRPEEDRTRFLAKVETKMAAL